MIMIMRVEKISNTFKKAKKGRAYQDKKIKKIQKEIKFFLFLFLIIVWISGIGNILAQSNWVLYHFSDDPTLNGNYYSVLNSLGNFLVGIELSKVPQLSSVSWSNYTGPTDDILQSIESC
ncbi:hypothetical protein HDU92_006918 [Lobulomyces angularis]|nr:hypothetical protein HDU92_006918 [Lobulomyces angularis]